MAFYRGVLVDSFLQTNIPDIYAAGDCIESYDLARHCLRVNALWPNATEQGRIAGMNMAGHKTTYHGSLAMNSVELFGYSVIVAGVGKGSGPEYEVHARKDGDGNYRRLVFRDDVLIGFILAGETKNAGLLTALVREGKRLGLRKDRLLESRKIIYPLFYEYRAPTI